MVNKVTTYQGCIVGVDHLESMKAAAIASRWGEPQITQGGRNRTVKASAKTHYNDDIVDISVRGKTKKQVWEFADNLFETGNVPFIRGYTNDGFSPHIHCLFAPAKYGSWQLQQQYREWLNSRGDGLVGNRPYVGPSGPLVSWAKSMYNPSNVRLFANPSIFQPNANVTTWLYGLNRDRRPVTRLLPGQSIAIQSQIYRWDRWNYVTRSSEIFFAADYLTEIKTIADVV